MRHSLLFVAPTLAITLLTSAPASGKEKKARTLESIPRYYAYSVTLEAEYPRLSECLSVKAHWLKTLQKDAALTRTSKDSVAKSEFEIADEKLQLNVLFFKTKAKCEADRKAALSSDVD